jgi:hypothetical protein
MFLLLLLLVVVGEWGINGSCSPLPIVHNMQNCAPSIWPEYAWCPNQGWWDCSRFRCFYDTPPESGNCALGNVDQTECCTHLEIHFADLWFTPDAGILPRRELKELKTVRETEGRRIPEEIDQFGDPDWSWRLYNIYFSGYGNNISINGTLYEDAYDSELLGSELYLSVNLYYNRSCGLMIELFINGSLVVTHVSEDLDLHIRIEFMLYHINILRTMYAVLFYPPFEKVAFVSLGEDPLTAEQHMDLYLQGNNRSVDYEVCNGDEECIGGAGVSSTYQTLTVVFGVLFAVFLLLSVILIILILYWWGARYSATQAGTTYKMMTL